MIEKFVYKDQFLTHNCNSVFLVGHNKDKTYDKFKNLEVVSHQTLLEYFAYFVINRKELSEVLEDNAEMTFEKVVLSLKKTDNKTTLDLINSYLFLTMHYGCENTAANALALCLLGSGIKNTLQDVLNENIYFLLIPHVIAIIFLQNVLEDFDRNLLERLLNSSNEIKKFIVINSEHLNVERVPKFFRLAPNFDVSYNALKNKFILEVA